MCNKNYRIYGNLKRRNNKNIAVPIYIKFNTMYNFFWIKPQKRNRRHQNGSKPYSILDLYYWKMKRDL